VVGGLMAGGGVIAAVCLPSIMQATGLSERMTELKGLLIRKMTRYREYREAMKRADPVLRQTMAGMTRGAAWYARQSEVRAVRESRFYAMSAAEHIFITRAQTVADCDFQHAVIELYENEFDDKPQVARKHFWNAIAQSRAELMLMTAGA
jgi:hypothetical protein